MNQTLIPLLIYDDIQAAHDFLIRAFGFTSSGVQSDDNGQAVHGEVRIGETTIWLHRVAKENQLVSPRDLPAISSGLVVFVDDVDAHCQRARAAGAHIEKDAEDTSYGMREYGARDLEGHRWWFEMSLK